MGGGAVRGMLARGAGEVIYEVVAYNPPGISTGMWASNTWSLMYIYSPSLLKLWCLQPTGSEERGELWVGSVPDAILPSCQDMKPNHYNCIKMNIVG